MRERVRYLADLVLLPEKAGTLYLAHGGINHRVVQTLYERREHLRDHDFQRIVA